MLVWLPIFAALQKVKRQVGMDFFPVLSVLPSLFSSSTHYLSQINSLLVFQDIETIPAVCYHS